MDKTYITKMLKVWGKHNPNKKIIDKRTGDALWDSHDCSFDISVDHYTVDGKPILQALYEWVTVETSYIIETEQLKMARCNCGHLIEITATVEIEQRCPNCGSILIIK
jgi:hypothetical protein